MRRRDLRAIGVDDVHRTAHHVARGQIDLVVEGESVDEPRLLRLAGDEGALGDVVAQLLDGNVAVVRDVADEPALVLLQ